jgi:hypothetical protein
MKIDTNGIQDFLEKSAPGQFDASKTRPSDEGDASLRISYASLIDQAMQDAETDVDAIQQAQELLLSGELDNPDNARTAAEDIIKFGL